MYLTDLLIFKPLSCAGSCTRKAPLVYCIITSEKGEKMDITTFSNFRQNLKMHLDKVLSNHTPLVVKRANGEDVVIISKSDYESLEETLFLLKSPKNAERLLKGIKDLEQGFGLERK